MSRLYPCVYCTEDGYCKKYSDEEVTSWCVQSPCKDEKPSNADRIRSMTDEELADWLATAIARHYDKEAAIPEFEKGLWLDWLTKEALDDEP